MIEKGVTMTDQERLDRLELEVRRSHALVRAMALSLLVVFGLGAATMTDQAVHGKLSILDQNGETKTSLHPNGDVDIGGEFRIKGESLQKKLSTIEATVNDQLSALNNKVNDQLNALSNNALKYDVYQVIVGARGQSGPGEIAVPFPNEHYTQTIDKPFGKQVVGVWHEIADENWQIKSWATINTSPNGNKVNLTLRFIPPGARVRINLHILYR
jgi:hypothetical protein